MSKKSKKKNLKKESKELINFAASLADEPLIRVTYQNPLGDLFEKYAEYVQDFLTKQNEQQNN